MAIVVRFKTKDGLIRSVRVTEDGTLYPPRRKGDWNRGGTIDVPNTSQYFSVYDTGFVGTPGNEQSPNTKNIFQIINLKITSEHMESLMNICNPDSAFGLAELELSLLNTGKRTYIPRRKARKICLIAPKLVYL